MKKIYKKLITIFGVVAGIEAFFRLYPAFGGKVTDEDRESYKSRCRYMKGKKFIYPDEWKMDGLSTNEKVSSKGTRPDFKLPVYTPDFNIPEKGKLKFTWFGHSSILLQVSGKNILIDPVLFKRFFPIPKMGPKRFSDNPVKPDDLPHIDIMLITHDHHDHLEPRTIKKLDHKVDRYIVPIGVEKHLIKWGIDAKKIKSLSWWESTTVDNIENADESIEFTCTPSRHFSGRRLTGQNQTEYCSWVIKTPEYKIFDSGDGSIGKHFEKIHNCFGDFDLAFMECGQYSDKWHYSHMYPEESADMAEAVGAKAVVPIHWGAFCIADHAWDDSIVRYTDKAEELGLNVLTPHISETVDFEHPEDYKDKWWEI